MDLMSLIEHSMSVIKDASSLASEWADAVDSFDEEVLFKLEVNNLVLDAGRFSEIIKPHECLRHGVILEMMLCYSIKRMSEFIIDTSSDKELSIDMDDLITLLETISDHEKEMDTALFEILYNAISAPASTRPPRDKGETYGGL